MKHTDILLHYNNTLYRFWQYRLSQKRSWFFYHRHFFKVQMFTIKMWSFKDIWHYHMIMRWFGGTRFVQMLVYNLCDLLKIPFAERNIIRSYVMLKNPNPRHILNIQRYWGNAHLVVKWKKSMLKDYLLKSFINHLCPYNKILKNYCLHILWQLTFFTNILSITCY